MNKIVVSLTFLAVPISAVSMKNDPMAKLVAKRHSGYAFDANRMVSQEQLAMIMKAGSIAPSSYNDQPWMFVVCDKAKNPEAYAQVMNTLVEFNQGWAKNAPVLMVTIAHTNSHQGQPNRWAQYDTGAAAMCMVLQATSLGLMAHQMGGFDADAIKSAFNMPADCVPMAVMAIGYEVEPMPERGKKERKSLDDIFFMGTLKK